MIFTSLKLISLIFFHNVLCQKTPYNSEVKTIGTGENHIAEPSSGLNCPENDTTTQIFPLPCLTNEECHIMGPGMICCSKKCIKGVKTIEIPSTTTRKTIVAQTTLPPSSTSPPPPSLICPGKEIRVPFFSQRCFTDKDCTISPGMLCCSNRCLKGVPPPKQELKHSPSWFGLVERHCPVDPLAEILEIKECQSDADCGPRICCLDKYKNTSGGGEIVKSYCRTPQPSLERFPVANRLMEPLRIFASYMQCTPPPPPLLDLFPKECKNTLDCFPNLCCQENGRKYCRPPKRSLLSFVAGVGQRLVPMDAAKKLIERLN